MASPFDPPLPTTPIGVTPPDYPFQDKELSYGYDGETGNFPDFNIFPDQENTVLPVEYFGDCWIEKEHYRDEGLRQGAIYGTGITNSVIIRLHAPFERLKVTWLIQSKYGPPKVPDPLLFDTNAVFLHGERCVLSPKLLATLVAHCWKLWGCYHYALVAPITLTSDFYTGSDPFDSVPVSDTGGPSATFPVFKVPAANFVRGLIDPNPNPPIPPIPPVTTL